METTVAKFLDSIVGYKVVRTRGRPDIGKHWVEIVFSSRMIFLLNVAGVDCNMIENGRSEVGLCEKGDKNGNNKNI